MTFGEKLYELRRQRGLSQEALARKLGVSRQAISRWELGEVVPDTANVLAVSRIFGVSTDFLLQDDCLSEGEAPAVCSAEQSLKERQEAVGKGMMFRFCALAGPAVWHLNAAEGDRLLLFFALGWTLLFGILLARTMKQVRRLNEQVADKLLKRDAIAVCCICFLPLLLEWVPGRWEILLSELAMVPPLQKNWLELRKVYDLPLKDQKR